MKEKETILRGWEIIFLIMIIIGAAMVVYAGCGPTGSKCF
jgi:hypothetical protein